eukprot:COSAG02_NODE_1465_length_12485_cov_9.526804_13_plen_98_part_00
MALQSLGTYRRTSGPTNLTGQVVSVCIYGVIELIWAQSHTHSQDQGTRGGSLNATKAGIDDARRLSDMLKQTNGDGFCTYTSELRLRDVAHYFLAAN